MESINYAEVSKEQLEEWHTQRQESLRKASNGMIQEPFTFCPIENELRYEHKYIRLGHMLTHESGECTLEIYIDPLQKRFHLAFIGVHDKQKGIGTKVMTLLTSLADKYGYMMDLEITPKFGVGKRVLNRFYKKFGFERHPLHKDMRVRQAKNSSKKCTEHPRIKFL